jgi:hypothetical protein
MSRTHILFAVAAFVLLSSTGCRRSVPLENGGNLLTLTNLRARGNQLTSINEWRGHVIIPACTPVLVRRARGREIIFDAAGTRYRYIIHRSSRLPVQTHLQHYFGTQCPKLDQMTPVDAQGVQTGMPAIGMSKAGVIAALGYPPDHETPDLNMPAWTFWGSSGRVVVHFQGDTVASIDGMPGVQQVPPAQTLPAGTATATAGSQTPVQQTQPAQDDGGGGGIEIVEHGEGDGPEVVQQQ